MDIFAALVAFGVSAFLLIFRPFSKAYSPARWLDVASSAILLLLGLAQVVCILFALR
jgi:hypothetical protein